MPQFSITRQIDSPPETVWNVLDDFGDIQRWNPGVKASKLTSDGPVAEGSTRHCDFVPLGSANERIVHYDPNQQLTVDIYKTSMLPISWGEADFNLEANDAGTLLTVNYRYTLNLMGRLLPGWTDTQLRKGIGALTKSLKQECEEMSSSLFGGAVC